MPWGMGESIDLIKTYAAEINAPWTMDQDNERGVVVKDDKGNIVHECDFRDIPTERGAAFCEQIIRDERANSRAMVAIVNNAIRLIGFVEKAR